MVTYRPISTLGHRPKAAFRPVKVETPVELVKPKTKMKAEPRRSVYKPVGIRPVTKPEEIQDEFEDVLVEEPEDVPEVASPELPEDIEEPCEEEMFEAENQDEAEEPEGPEEPEEPEEPEVPEEPEEPEDEEPEETEALQEANQSSLKRQFEPDDELSAKRRKITSTLSFETEPEKLLLLSRWNLANDRAARYVMQAASLEETRAVAKTGWRPARNAPRADGRDGKTPAEQLNEKILAVREEAFGPQGGRAVDVVAAFVQKWQLDGQDDAALRSASSKDLRFVLKEFDGSRSVSALLEEAALEESIPKEACDTTEDAAGDELGVLTCGRLNRLELIDPSADALVVGDANLTFSILLAKHREALGHVGRIVATTFETIEILRERYPEIDATVKELESKDAEVLHNVDGTRLAVDPRFQDMVKKFEAVYYNFPHAGVVQGFFDGHPFVRWRHENLMHLFFRALRSFVKPNGLVKVSSNCCAKGVRFSDIIAGAQNSEFVHVETLPFQEWSLRGYRRSYGDRRDANRRPEENENYRSQSANSDMVYTFRYMPSGDAPPKALIRRPPTKNDLLMSAEGKLRGVSQEQRQRRAEEIYELFLTYVQGIHVG